MKKAMASSLKAPTRSRRRKLYELCKHTLMLPAPLHTLRPCGQALWRPVRQALRHMNLWPPCTRMHFYLGRSGARPSKAVHGPVRQALRHLSPLRSSNRGAAVARLCGARSARLAALEQQPLIQRAPSSRPQSHQCAEPSVRHPPGRRADSGESGSAYRLPAVSCRKIVWIKKHIVFLLQCSPRQLNTLIED